MLAREIMTDNPVTITPDASLRDAAMQMSEHNVGALPVFDGNELQGIITDRDMVVRAVATGYGSDATVDEIMTRACITCPEDIDLEDAIDLMQEYSVRRLVVTDSGPNDKPVGIFSVDDIARRGHDVRLSGQAMSQLNQSH